jgi:hypothetical protein
VGQEGTIPECDGIVPNMTLVIREMRDDDARWKCSTQLCVVLLCETATVCELMVNDLGFAKPHGNSSSHWYLKE